MSEDLQEKPHVKGEMKYVTINEVPFLQQSVQKFKSHFQPLSIDNKEISDLELDLEHIIEFVDTNGLKSYSLVINKDFAENEDQFFENLHIVKVDDNYESFVFKYNAEDDSKKFDILDFTGDLEIYSIDNKYEGTVIFQDGLQKAAEPAPPTPPTSDEIAGSGGSDLAPEHSWVWYFFHSIFYGSGASGNVYYGSPWDNGGSSSGSGGVIVIMSSGGTQPLGSPITTPTENYGGGSTVIVPNEPVWTFPASQHMMANRISQRLSIVDSEVVLWLKNPVNMEIVSEIYDYSNEEGNIGVINNFVKQMIIKIKNNPGVFTSIKPFLIEKNIDDANLNDPCSKEVFASIKNTTNCAIAKVLAKLNANPSVYNTYIKTEVPQNGRPGNTKWNSVYNYTIKINPNYNNATKLGRASILFHELIHAYFMSLFDDYHNGSPQNLNAYDDFPILFQKYVEHTYPDGSDAHHEQMAIKYVNAIACALQEYQTGIAVPSGVQPQQVYTDLAWGGLQEAPIFNSSNSPLTNSDRERIVNRYNCEIVGHEVLGQTPIGNPCL